MNRRLKVIIKSAGSIMDISPDADYRRFVPKESIAKRINRHWEKTGRYIGKSIERHADEQKEKK